MEWYEVKMAWNARWWWCICYTKLKMWIFRNFGKVVFGFLNVLKKAKLFVNEINKYVVVPLDHLISDDKEERRHQRTSLPLPIKVMIKRSPALTTSRWSYERQGILLKWCESGIGTICRREDRKICVASANQKTVCFSKHMVYVIKKTQKTYTRYYVDVTSNMGLGHTGYYYS